VDGHNFIALTSLVSANAEARWAVRNLKKKVAANE